MKLDEKSLQTFLNDLDNSWSSAIQLEISQMYESADRLPTQEISEITSKIRDVEAYKISQEKLLSFLAGSSCFVDFLNFIETTFMTDLSFDSCFFKESLLETFFGLKYSLKFEMFENIEEYFKHFESIFQFSQPRRLYENENLFELMFNEPSDQRVLSDNDLNWLINAYDNKSCLESICKNKFLLKYALKNFMFDLKKLDEFNSFVKNISWYSMNHIQNFFDLIQSCNKTDAEILKLSNTVQYLYESNFSTDDKIQIIAFLRTNEQARDTFAYIAENLLLDNFEDMNALMKHLKKSTKKTTLNF